jgi:hypothetical protein
LKSCGDKTIRESGIRTRCHHVLSHAFTARDPVLRTTRSPAGQGNLRDCGIFKDVVS